MAATAHVKPPSAVLAGFGVAIALLGFGCSVSSDVSRELGAICEDRDECADRCLSGQRFPDGLCSLSCDDDGDCPDGASCVDREGGVCLFSCDAPVDCEFLGDAWRCLAQPERGAQAGAQVMVCIGRS